MGESFDMCDILSWCEDEAVLSATAEIVSVGNDSLGSFARKAKPSLA